jgi:hypothetical protein
VSYRTSYLNPRPRSLLPEDDVDKINEEIQKLADLVCEATPDLERQQREVEEVDRKIIKLLEVLARR